MKALVQFIRQLTISQLTIIALLISLPAFLINLGAVAFIGDEAIRSLVALEMKLSDNFLVPTMNGIPYYNKPPLYNWMIYGMSTVFGYFGEWPARLTTIVFLALFSAAVYYFTRKQYDRLTSITVALMILTSGRILFWDSMLGLIDICFSFIVFTNFMVLFHFGSQKKYTLFFITSYLLFAIAFLLKGLPAVVFQGISMITALILHGDFRKKFLSPSHFIGIGISLIPLLAYYIPYAQEVSLDKVFSVLFDQSMQRTATHHGVLKTVMHVFTFPFEQLYHFLPWSLLVILFFHPAFKSMLKNDLFLRFNFWMFIANIPVYWLSVQVYPRYILMFIPLLNIMGYCIAVHLMNENQILGKLLRNIFIGMVGLVGVAVFLMPIVEKARHTYGIWWIWVIGILLMSFLLVAMISDKHRILLWFCIALLVTRSIFNLVVLPDRANTFHENRCREDCRRLADKFDHSPWFIYGKTEIHQVARFYTTAYTDRLIQKTGDVIDTSAYYIVNRNWYGLLEGDVVDSLLIEGNRRMSFMKLDQQSPSRWTFHDPE